MIARYFVLMVAVATAATAPSQAGAQFFELEASSRGAQRGSAAKIKATVAVALPAGNAVIALPLELKMTIQEPGRPARIIFNQAIPLQYGVYEGFYNVPLNPNIDNVHCLVELRYGGQLKKSVTFRVPIGPYPN